jgi:phosphoribosyl 1,2-cyclic phosphodiesterase
MRIKFWGTRGSIPVPGKDTTEYGGNTTCVEVTLQGNHKLIIDAGTGIRSLGEKLATDMEHKKLYLLVTHLHWDHNLGFPFFSPIYDPSFTIFVDGHPLCMRGLRNTFDNRMGDGFFPIKFDDLKAKIEYMGKLKDNSLRINDTLIESIELQHPQGGVGFKFQEGEKTVVFLTDNELREDAWIGRTPKEYEKFCQGVDVLIHDCQYTPEEINNRKGWGHSDYRSVVELACRAEVKRLILFHHDPSRKDKEVKEMEAICNEIAHELQPDLVIEAAKEQSEIEL